MYRDIPEELRKLIEPIVTDHGLELVDVERHAGAGGRLRVIVDNPSGDGRVDVDRCAAVSRELGTHLDAGDWTSGSYTLEVSSPGLDRPLTRPKDFAAAVGREIKLETREPRDGRRRFRGRLDGFDAGIARLCVDGTEVEIPFDEIARARSVYEFSREDFARS